MSDLTNSQDCGREPRYRIPDAVTVQVTSTSFHEHAKVQVQEGKLIDVSQHGAKIESPHQIPVDHNVRLHLVIEDLGMELYVTGRTCWSRTADEGSWLTGCELAPGLPDGVINRLTAGGRLDRHFSLGFQEETTLEARQESGKGRIAVTLRNYSDGGFCFLAAEALPLDEPLLFCVDESENVLIAAEPAWQLCLKDGFLTGCSFLKSSDFETLKEVAKKTRRKVNCEAEPDSPNFHQLKQSQTNTGNNSPLVMACGAVAALLGAVNLWIA